MIRTLHIDDATTRRLERHETMAHAIPSRRVRDLGDSLVLFDPRDPDPFWNRMVSVRWPAEPAAFERRLSEAITMFALDARQPHIWPSPEHNAPVDLISRLRANGFADIGGGHVMVLTEPAACPPLLAGEVGDDVVIQGIRRAADAGPTDVEDVALVLAESFGAVPARANELAGDLRITLDDPRIALVLVRVDGEPAAVAKSTSFDGFIYLSSIGTRAAYRGRGLAALATRHAVAIGGGTDSQLAYLGVFSGNAPAMRLYERLGFASIGEAPDMLLE
ncbi:MAG TPA: GNAT family N-acetyltransferase [Candidatus Limnocylindrales bacterium]